MKQLLLACLFIVPAFADEAADKAVEELSTAYGKLSGFIATYHSESKGKTLDAIAALDRPSKSAAWETTMKGTKDDDTKRMWIPADEDAVYFFMHGHLLKAVKIQAEMNFLSSFQKTLLFDPARIAAGKAPETAAPDNNYNMWPQALLAKDSYEGGLFLRNSTRPAWWAAVENSVIESSDEKSITFKTPANGLVTIGREHGLLVKQSMPASDEKERILQLTRIELNPGREKLTNLTKAWDDTAATRMSTHALTGKIRQEVFQILIRDIEGGRLELGRVDAELEKRREELRSIATGWIEQSPIGKKPTWKAVLDHAKGQMRAHWIQNVPGAKADDEAAFEAYLAKPEARTSARDSLVAEMETHAIARGQVLSELFESPLETTNEAGEAVKHSIETATVKAYGEAVVEAKISEYWGERKGLD